MLRLVLVHDSRWNSEGGGGISPAKNEGMKTTMFELFSFYVVCHRLAVTSPEDLSAKSVLGLIDLQHTAHYLPSFL